MKRKGQSVLFCDSLSGKPGPGWAEPPRDFRNVPGHGPLCLLDTATRRKRYPLPAAGDATWSKYRVEFEFMPGGKKGYTGLNFHVQPNGDACNFHFPSGCSGRNEAFQTMCIFGKSMPWQLHPESQGYALFRHDAWSRVRLDVGSTSANLFVNGGPVLSMFDLPFRRGGIQFWSFHDQVFIRNLWVTDLSHSRVTPVFKNPWMAYADANRLGNWATALVEDEEATEGASAPDEAVLAGLEWWPAQVDKRGVVNLSRTFRDRNTNATAYAATTATVDAPTRVTLYLTYTDELMLWCNGTQVFCGEPRGWDAPNRDTHFGGRLIPDDHAVSLRLHKGENALLVRTRVVDPWGWGFWMRMDNSWDRTSRMHATAYSRA